MYNIHIVILRVLARVTSHCGTRSDIIVYDIIASVRAMRRTYKSSTSGKLFLHVVSTIYIATMLFFFFLFFFATNIKRKQVGGILPKMVNENNLLPVVSLACHRSSSRIKYVSITWFRRMYRRVSFHHRRMTYRYDLHKRKCTKKHGEKLTFATFKIRHIPTLVSRGTIDERINCT